MAKKLNEQVRGCSTPSGKPTMRSGGFYGPHETSGAEMWPIDVTAATAGSPQLNSVLIGVRICDQGLLVPLESSLKHVVKWT